MPPLFNTCTPDGRALLQMGDLRLTVRFKLARQRLQLQVHLGLEVPVTTEVQQPSEGGPQRLGLSTAPGIRIEAETQNLARGDQSVFKLVRSLLELELVPQIVSYVEGLSLSLPVPHFDLSTVSEALPTGTTITAEIAKISHRDGYTVVAGDIK